MMAQIPYLQPFDNGNKRVSRLSANVALIRTNLSPLSFVDVSRNLYRIRPSELAAWQEAWAG